MRVSDEELKVVGDTFSKVFDIVDKDNPSVIDKQSCITLLTTIIDAVDPIGRTYSAIVSEVDEQKQDLDHMLIDQRIRLGIPIDKQQQLMQDLEDATIIRRSTKDASTVIKQLITQLINVRSYISSMDNRLYTPRSAKFNSTGVISTTPNNDDPTYLKHLSEEYAKIRVMATNKSNAKTTVKSKTPDRRTGVTANEEEV